MANSTKDENNNDIPTTRRTATIKKSLVVLLCLGFLGSVAAIGVVATKGSSSDNLLETEWAPFLQKPSELQLEKLRRIRELSPFPAPLDGEFRADVCYTIECLDSALNLLESMNKSVDPCDDFFEFSCGRWLANNPIPETSSRWSQFNILRVEVNNITQGILTSADEPDDFKPVKQVKQFYKLCTDVDKLETVGIDPVIATLNTLGKWPAVTTDWKAEEFDLFGALAEIRRVYQDAVIIRPYVSQDIRNTTRSRIYLDQPGFFLSRSVLLDNSAGAQTRKEAYKTYFVNVAKVFAAKTGATVTDEELQTQADEIIAFETELAKISAKDEDRTDTERIYNERALDKYQEETDKLNPTNPHAKVNWKSYLDKLFSSSGITIEAAETLIVLEVDYIKNLIPILDKTNLKTIANYVMWRLVAGIIPETTKEMRQIGFEFEKVNSGLKEPAERATSCASTSLNGFGMAIGVPYIEKAFNKDAKDNVDQMVVNLRSAFKELLTTNTWMDDATKKAAAGKADAINSFMAFPEWLNDKTRLEKEFEGLEIDTADYLKSVIALSQWMGDQSLKTLRAVTDKDYWLTYPGVVNAFYSPEFNSITFPAGILQPPFYRSKGPESINYGGIGMVIGHEITHGFDDQGSQYDAEGNAKEWWSEEIRKKFTEKAQCIVDQYSAFETPAKDHVNGDLTSGENIADNGGIRQSYLAYQNWIKNNNGGKEERRLPGLEGYTPDQLFFLGYANVWCENITPEALANQIRTDPHSPAHFRVLGPLRNSEIFAEKWKCPVNSGMNPPKADKCLLW